MAVLKLNIKLWFDETNETRVAVEDVAETETRQEFDFSDAIQKLGEELRFIKSKINDSDSKLESRNVVIEMVEESVITGKK